MLPGDRPGYAHFAARRGQHAGDHLEQGAFPGAVRADHCHALPSADLESDAFQGHQAIVAHCQVLYRQERFSRLVLGVNSGSDWIMELMNVFQNAQSFS